MAGIFGEADALPEVSGGQKSSKEKGEGKEMETGADLEGKELLSAIYTTY